MQFVQYFNLRMVPVIFGGINLGNNLWCTTNRGWIHTRQFCELLDSSFGLNCYIIYFERRNYQLGEGEMKNIQLRLSSLLDLLLFHMHLGFLLALGVVLYYTVLTTGLFLQGKGKQYQEWE